MRTFAGFCAGALALGAIAAAAQPAVAQDKVTFALPVNALAFAYVYVADNKGYWKDAGLEVELPVIAGLGATNALLGGQVEFTGASTTTLLAARARGQNPVAIASVFDRFALQIVADKDLVESSGVSMDSSLADRAQILKGKTIAIDRVNSILHAMARYVLNEAGIDPEKDVTFAPIASPAMPAALASGQVDAFVMSPPWTVKSVADGEGVYLVDPLGDDLADLTPITYSVIMTREGYCEEHTSICERLVGGIVKAARYIREDLDGAVAAVQPAFEKMDPALLRASLETLAKGIPADLSMSDESFGIAQEFSLKSGQLKQDEKYESFDGAYTNAYIN